MKRDLVLVNGWGMTHDVWQALAPALDGGRCHAVDIPDVVRAADTVDAAVEALARTAPERCTVVGWSLGAQLALQWARRHPEQVERLALIAATPCFVQRPDWPSAMEAAVFEDFRALFETQPSQALARFAHLQARGERDATALARALRAVVIDATPERAAALRAGLRLLRDTDLRPVACEVRQPVLLVHGGADGLVPVAAAQWLQRALPAARLHVVPEAGHAPHVSHAAPVAAQLADFLYG